jgi:putative ABC transport system permease protein
MLTDLTFSIRSLRRQPGFAMAAIATLAVGIGATTAIFSTVNAALLRPLPFPDPQNLFEVYTPATDGRFTTGRDSGVELARLNDPGVSIEHAAGSTRLDSTILRDDGTPVSTIGYGVTEGFFEVFRLPMKLGRAFTRAEHAPGAPSVVVLSNRLWRDLFGSDPSIVGKSMRIANGPPQPATIVGVAPPELDMPHGAGFWVNFSITPQSTGHGFDGFVRIKPGTRLERLQSEMAGVMAGIARDYGMLGKNRRYDLRPLVTAMVGDLGSTLVVVLAAAVLLLLLACVNVTNLMLARGSVRAREIAVRVALGAGRGRIVRQLLTESLVLSTAGTVVGLAIAYIGVRVLLAFGASELPRLDDVPFVDVRVLGFAFGGLVVTAFLVGFAPALRLAGTSLRTLMNESGRSSTGGGAAHRTLKTMIVAEIALAITLVAGAGWLVRSFANLGTTDAGFVSKGRLVFDVMLPPSRLLPPPGTARITNEMIAERQLAWTHGLEAHLGPIAGVKAVATTATLPFGSDRDGVLYIGVQGDPIDPDHPLVSRAHRVHERFFDAMGIKIVAGRGFTADDRTSTTPVAIVNRTFVRRYLGTRDPLTARFTAGYPEVPAAPVLTVVGVVDDVKYVSLAEAADPAYYTPMAQSPYFAQAVVLNTALADPLSIAASVRSAIHAMDPELPATPQSLSNLVSASLRRQRLGMTLMLLFALAALALAAVGIYGVIAYASAQRVGEVATRMALGATPADVFWLLMDQGRLLAILGTAVGLGVAYASGKAGSSLLYEVRASDPVILVTATAIVLAITSVAILLPARRVSRIEPSRILRMD